MYNTLSGFSKSSWERMQGFCFRLVSHENHKVRKQRVSPVCFQLNKVFRLNKLTKVLHIFNFFKGCSNYFAVIRALATVILVNYLTYFFEHFIIFSQLSNVWVSAKIPVLGTVIWAQQWCTQWQPYSFLKGSYLANRLSS